MSEPNTAAAQPQTGPAPAPLRDPKAPYAMVILLMAVGACFINAWVAVDPVTRVSCLITAGLLLLLLLRMLLRGMSMVSLAGWSMAVGWCHLFVTTWLDGGIFSFKSHWLLVLMIAQYYVLDWGKGWWWAVLTLLTVLAQAWLGLVWPSSWPRMTGVADLTMDLSDLLLPMLSIFLVLQYFRRQYDEALEAHEKRQQALQAKQRELEQTLQMRDQFMASVSHELRTPMNQILGLNTLLLERVQGKPQASKVLEYTRQSADHLMTVINDVLDHSQWRTGQITPHIECFALRDTLHSAFGLFQPRVEGKPIRYVCDIAAEVPQWVQTDQHRLMQVLVNLLGNAIKFTHEGQVCLRVRQSPDGVVFEVQDSGIGIPVEQQSHIFERFQQADPGIQSRYGGSGLGLAISQRLVQMLGGELRFKSQAGQGSTFWFSLPLLAQPAPAPYLPEHRPAPTDAVPARRFLVVDDHPVNRLLVRQALLHGWPQAEVLEAPNGAVALQLLAQGPAFDLVLMDMVMPEMDGIETTEAMRASSSALLRQTPVLGLTANVTASELQRFEQAGLQGLLLKPFEIARLRSEVERLLQT